MEMVDAAAAGKKKKVIKFIKSTGPTWPLMVSMHGEAILNCAAQRGQTDLIKSLVRKYGADVNQGDAEDRTACYSAANSNQALTIKLLHRLGADVDQVNFFLKPSIYLFIYYIL